MYLACVFLTGLAYQRFSIRWSAIISAIFILLEWWIGSRTESFKKAAGRSIILLSAFFLGIFHMQRAEDFRAAYMSKMIDGGQITVWGECVQVENTEYGKRGFLSDCYIRLDRETMPCNDIVVYTSEGQFQIGRIHKIDGKVNMFSTARNEGNFDACRYYQSLKIDFAVDAEEISLLDEESVGNIRTRLSIFRDKISRVYNTCLSEKAAGFYQAMVLGDKLDLDEHLKDLFLIGGISHILAISGLHVSILGKGLYRVLRKRGISFGVAGISAGILLSFYSVMVGSSTSTLRAVGMMICMFLAQWIGRSYDMLNSLGLMVLYLLWENPFLIENTGFWFSITALLGVGIIGDRLQGIWMSLGITLATIPVTALSYYEIPIYSPLVNVIVLPLLSPIFILAIAGGLLGVWGMSFNVISILLTPCEWLLAFYECICEMVGKLPGASLICGKPEAWQVAIYYVLLLLGGYVLNVLKQCKKLKERKIVMVVLLLLCALCIFFPKEKPFEISFLDVGQGDGIYISDGSDASFFIDGGSSNIEAVGEYRILPFLKSKGISKIDYWFVSHLDMDHISGLLEILESEYPVQHIVLSEHCSKGRNYKKLKTLTEKTNTEIVFIKVGHKIVSNNIEITCIAPWESEEDENESSLVLYVKRKENTNSASFDAIFAGDISSEKEKQLCESGVFVDIDLFKANHHGSNYSNSTELLCALQPEYIVVSCSEWNRYGHPGKKAVERMKACGAKVFYTMEDGQITFPLIQ